MKLLSSPPSHDRRLPAWSFLALVAQFLGAAPHALSDRLPTALLHLTGWELPPPCGQENEPPPQGAVRVGVAAPKRASGCGTTTPPAPAFRPHPPAPPLPLPAPAPGVPIRLRC